MNFAFCMTSFPNLMCIESIFLPSVTIVFFKIPLLFRLYGVMFSKLQNIWIMDHLQKCHLWKKALLDKNKH